MPYDPSTDDSTRVTPADAPEPPPSRRWTVELAVAALGLVAGLGAALLFLG